MQISFDQAIDRRQTNSLKWSRYPKDVLPLWVADMDFPAPEPVRRTLRSAIEHGIFGYELPSRKLAATVAARMERLYGWQVAPETVVAVPGIVAGFNAAARAVCKAGEGILLQPPVYHPFLEVPEDTSTVSQCSPLRRIAESHTVRYELDWPVFEQAVHSSARTAMFLLCHPHNPTGQIHSRTDLERMAEICLREGVVICSDEIHSELLLGQNRHTPMASIDPEIARRTITLISPSKTFNLVGLFCGFAIITDPDLRARYRAVLHHTALHVNSFGLMAAEVACSGLCDEWLDALRAYLTANRDFVVEFVARHLAGVKVTVPQATYLAWLDFETPVRDGRIPPNVYRFLLEKGKVALNPGEEFGPGGENFARLNFGCPRATLSEALERIRSALDGAAHPGGTGETNGLAPPE